MLSLKQFFRSPERSPLFHAMLDKLGMREAILSRPNSAAVMARAETRCAGCGREAECAAWMEQNETASEAPGYCKNHDLFERLKHDIEAEETIAAA